jgi:ribosomal protein L29
MQRRQDGACVRYSAVRIKSKEDLRARLLQCKRHIAALQPQGDGGQSEYPHTLRVWKASARHTSRHLMDCVR